jgi:hypothetical protein
MFRTLASRLHRPQQPDDLGDPAGDGEANASWEPPAVSEGVDTVECPRPIEVVGLEVARRPRIIVSRYLPTPKDERLDHGPSFRHTRRPEDDRSKPQGTWRSTEAVGRELDGAGTGLGLPGGLRAE